MELVADRVTFRYPGRSPAVLDATGLRVDEGVTGLVGVNGAGKTTLLRILALATRPDGGVVTLDGVDIHRARRREVASRIGFMPQDFALPAGSRVGDSLLFLAWLKGVPGATAGARATELLDALGLGARSGDRVAALSGGMQRRLALAQAMIARPDVLVLDEPTTGLDPEQRIVVRELLADHRFRAAITVVSSHVMEDVEILADRVALLEAGQIAFAGTLADFCTREDGAEEDAEHAFVRRLIGARG